MKVYDVFGMIPPPGERDGADVHERYEKIAGGRRERRRRRDVLRLPRRPLRRGRPSRSRGSACRSASTTSSWSRACSRTRSSSTSPVAFAHLDGDWYESTMTCLTRIAPLLVARRPDRARRLLQVVGLPRGGRRVLRGARRLPLEHRAKLHVVRALSAYRRRRRRRPASPPRSRSIPPSAIARVRAQPRGRPTRAGARRAAARAPATPRPARRAAIVAYGRGFPALAHAELAGVPPRRRPRSRRRSTSRAGLAVAPEETLAEVRALVAEDPPGVGPRAGTSCSRRSSASATRSWRARCSRVFDRARGRATRRVAGRRARRDSLRAGSPPTPDSPTAPAPPGGRRTVAIMDYGHPGADRASANIGDHVQSIAALGHLVRHRGVRLHGRRGADRAARRSSASATRPERAASTTSTPTSR